MQNISQELRQGAAIDGASSWRGFRNAVLRLLSPSITALPVLTFIEIFRVLDVVYVLIRTLRRRETAI